MRSGWKGNEGKDYAIYRQSCMDDMIEAWKVKRMPKKRVQTGVMVCQAGMAVSDEDPVKRKAEFSLSKMMIKLGLPTHMMGTVILKAAVMMSLETPDLVFSLMHGLYPRLAEQFDSTVSCIEHDLRSMITVAWERGTLSQSGSILGPAIRLAKPTNGEMIALLTERIKYELLNDEENK